MPAALRDALVLTAGLGTRLRPLTLVRAKPAIPLAGEPLITHIARWLSSQGVTDLVLNLHYKPESITQVVGDGVHLGCRVRYSWEQPAVLGSAGGPRLASPIVTAGLPASAPFFIVNGDTLTDLALAPLAAAHDASGALVTMALVPNRHPDRYGGVRLDARGQVTGFARRGADARGSYHFIGVQLAQARAFAAVPAGAIASSVGEVYDQLIAQQPGSVCGYVCEASFWDIGSVSDYWHTSGDFAARKEKAGDGRARRGRGARVAIDPTAAVIDSILWDDVRIGAGARIERCILTDGVTVPAGAHYAHAILMNGPGAGLLAAPLDTARD